MADTNVYKSLGLNGGEYINDTATHTIDAFAIQFTEDSVLGTGNVVNIDNIDDLETGQDATTFAKGDVIYGAFTTVQLASGACIAYKR